MINLDCFQHGFGLAGFGRGLGFFMGSPNENPRPVSRRGRKLRTQATRRVKHL
jgi:hypothetical protein